MDAAGDTNRGDDDRHESEALLGWDAQLFIVRAIRDVVACLIHVPQMNVTQIPRNETLSIVGKILLEERRLNLFLYLVIDRHNFSPNGYLPVHQHRQKPIAEFGELLVLDF